MYTYISSFIFLYLCGINLASKRHAKEQKCGSSDSTISQPRFYTLCDVTKGPLPKLASSDETLASPPLLYDIKVNFASGGTFKCLGRQVPRSP